MAVLKRVTIWILRTCAYVAGLVLLLAVAAVFLGGFTSFGAAIVTPWIAKLASAPGRVITIEQPGPLLTGALRIPAVTVSDEKGTYAEIRDIAVDWSPLAVLEGTFDASRVAAGEITLLRKPQIPESPATSDGGNFSLPLRIEIEKLQLPSIDLDSTVLGRALSLSANGEIYAYSDSISAKIAASRSDNGEAKLDADLEFAPAENTLTLNARFFEPEGGIVAGLLRLPGSPSIGVTAVGSGPLSAWRGDFTAEIDGRRTIAFQATHQQTTDGIHRLSLDGGGELATLLPPSLRPTFAGETSIDLAANFHEAGKLQIEMANITTGNMLLTASGSLDQTGDNDLKANLVGVGGPVAFRWPLANGEIAAAVSGIDLAATGPANAVKIDMQAVLASLAMPGVELHGIGLSARGDGFDLASRTGRLDTTLQIAESAFADPSLDRAVRAPIKVEAPILLSPQQIAFDPMTIESASIGGTISGHYALEDNGLDAQFRLFAIPGVLPDAIAGRLTGTVEIGGRASYVQSGDISVDDLKIVSSALTATGKAAYAENALSTNLKGELTDLGILVENASGKADFALTAAGPLNRLEADADVKIAEALFAGHRLEGFDLTATSIVDPAAPEATVTAKGKFDGQDVDLSTRLLSEAGKTSLPELSAAVGANTLNGALVFSKDFLPEGDLVFDFPEIELLAALAGQSLSGDLKGEISLTPRDDALGGRITASGTKLTRGEIVLSSPDIRLSVADFGKLAMDGTLQAGSLVSGSNGIDEPVLNFTREGEKTTFDLAARYDNAPASATGSLVQKGGGIEITLQQFAAAPRGVDLKLVEPTTAKVADGTVSFDQLTIAAGGGRLSARGSAGETLDVSARIEALPASLANAFASGLSASGAISGDVTATGPAADPKIEYALRWSDASVAQTRSAGLLPLTVSAKGSFAGQKLTLGNAEISGNGLSISGGGSLETSGSKPIAMTFSGGLPLGILAGQLASQGLVLEGKATVDVRISGSAAAPAISGTVSADGAKLVDVRRNIAVENLKVSVALDGKRANITTLSGKLSGGGTLTGQGSIDIASGGLPANITLTLDRAGYADGTMFSTSASGRLSLQGQLLATPVLSGAVDLGETAITVPQSLPTSLSQLDIAHKNAPADVRRQMAKVTAEETHGGGSEIGLDLKVSAPSRIFVRGRGIDAELGGSLTIRGTSTTPIVSGAFTLNRGRLTILTKRLDFTSGTITFGGGLIPLLNMTATTSSGNTTITVTIAGLADNPEITFSSSPALPQDEILAQLIFGQSISKLSPLQIAQLADAAAQLAGGGSSSLFNALRSGLGVDNLDITTDETGQAKVSAGKYLNERTYLELQQSGDGKAKAVINLDIGKGLKLRGEADGDGGGSAGIFYEKEY